jgi:hypothetical protein
MANDPWYDAPRKELQAVAGNLLTGDFADRSRLWMWLEEIALADFDGDWPSQQPDRRVLQDIPVASILLLCQQCRNPQITEPVVKWLLTHKLVVTRSKSESG